MQSAIAVANYFINKSLETGRPITPMQLVKLVYISHGWYLGHTGEPLIPEVVEAWKYGPVIPSVYHKFKSYGDTPIKSQAEELHVVNDEIIFLFPNVTDESAKKLLENVWNAYSNLDGLQLSTLTHQKGTPWDVIWNERGGKDFKSEPIPNDLIEKHYKEKINASTESA